MQKIIIDHEKSFTKSKEYMLTDTGLIFEHSRDTDDEWQPCRLKEFKGYLYYRDHSIHRLVARYFVPNPHPDKWQYVDHIDSNKMNNKADNLRWCDNELNQIYKYRGYDLAKKIGLYDDNGKLIKLFESGHRAGIYAIEKGLTSSINAHASIKAVGRMNAKEQALKYKCYGHYWIQGEDLPDEIRVIPSLRTKKS